LQTLCRQVISLPGGGQPLNHHNIITINVESHENAIIKGPHALYRAEVVWDGSQLSKGQLAICESLTYHTLKISNWLVPDI